MTRNVHAPAVILNSTMSYQIEFEQCDGFIHARVTGENSISNVQAYLYDIVQVSRERDCYRFLIEEQLQGPRLDVDQIFSIASEGAMGGLGMFHAIAFVDPKMGEMAYFAETVAMNRGMPVRVFQDVEEAKAWLAGQAEGADEQHIFDGNR